MVSQACILRTRLLVSSMRCMLSARLRVMLIGRPSGTATTIKVMAIMMVLSTYRRKSSHSKGVPSPVTKYIRTRNPMMSPAMM